MNNKKFEQLKSLSKLMDSQFHGPFGIRFGLDGILGLFPVLGDLVTTFISIYIVYGAFTLGCSVSVILRMALNVVIENLVEILPAFGAFFDIFWKANDKNITLLERHIEAPQKITLQSRILIFSIIGMMLVIVSFTAYMTYNIVVWILGLLS